MSNPTNTSFEKKSNTKGSPYFAHLTEASRFTSRDTIDQYLHILQQHKEEWVRLDIGQRIDILNIIRDDLLTVKNRWVSAECEAKGNPAGSLGEAEEWTIVATMFRALRTLKTSLLHIHKYGRPKIPGPVKRRPDGQTVASVFPNFTADRLLFLGVNGEVWMAPGTTEEDVVNTQAWAYHDRSLKGKVALVLGAGNASMLPVIDLLHKLFVELQVVILKLNPVNAHVGPLMEQGFRALIDRGFLRVVYGGMEEGSYVCSHNAVDELHLTGSDKTYEAIVFGTGEQGRKRKKNRDPLITKRFTGELGNVSPVMVVPGPWKKADIKEQAKQIASWLVANAGFACLTPRVIIQYTSWPHRKELINEIGTLLQNYSTRKAYYPGAHARHAEYMDAHPNALQFGEAEEKCLPWTIIYDANPENANDICFKREAFCGLLAETGIEAQSESDFIRQAVDFANNTLWGTLNATLIVHPRSLQNPDIASAVDRAIADLRYGTVSLNMLAYYSAYFMTSPWGAFPGHDIYDIQSGIGKTFNFLMFACPEKSVVRAPFKRFDPVTITSKRAYLFCRKLAEFEANPKWWKLPGLAFAALMS